MAEVQKVDSGMVMKLCSQMKVQALIQLILPEQKHSFRIRKVLQIRLQTPFSRSHCNEERSGPALRLLFQSEGSECTNPYLRPPLWIHFLYLKLYLFVPKAQCLQSNWSICTVQHKYFTSVQNLLKRSSLAFPNAAFIAITTSARVATLCKRSNLAKYDMVAEIQLYLPNDEQILHFNLLWVSPGAFSA